MYIYILNIWYKPLRNKRRLMRWVSPIPTRDEESGSSPKPPPPSSTDESLASPGFLILLAFAFGFPVGIFLPLETSRRMKTARCHPGDWNLHLFWKLNPYETTQQKLSLKKKLHEDSAKNERRKSICHQHPTGRELHFLHQRHVET